jgi:hypothetical protein
MQSPCTVEKSHALYHVTEITETASPGKNENISETP